MEEIKKEIQSLKRKTLYLWIIVICFGINSMFLYLSLIKGQSVIRDYYYDSLDHDRELNQLLAEQNQSLEESLSILQQFQP